METQSKKISNELNNLIIEKEKLTSKGINLKDENIVAFDNQISKLEKQLDLLDNKMQQIKLNPQSSMEAQNLKAKIDLAEQSLNNSKKEANDLGKKIEKLGKTRLKNLGVDVSFIGEGFKKVNSKIDSFKKKMIRLISTAMIFSLLRKGLTSLSNGFISLLKSNSTFANSLNQIKVNLMTAFAPIYNYVLPAINTLMSVLSKFTGTIANFVAGIFGKTASQAKNNAKQLYNQAKAQKAVNDEQENLASFDKLEVNKDNDSKGANGSGGIDFSKAKTPEIDEGILNFLNELKELIGDGKWFEVGSKIATSLNNCLTNLNLKSFFEKGKKIATNLINGINGFISTFDWGLLAKKLSKIIIGFSDMILTSLVLIDWQSIGKAIGDFILGIDWWGILTQILSIVCALFDAIVELIIGFGISILEHIIVWLPKVWEVIKSIPSWINDNVLQPIIGVFKQMGESILLALNAMWEGIKIGFQICWDWIVNIWNSAALWFNNTIIQPILNFFSNMWSNLISGASNAWLGIKNVFSSVASFFQSTFQNAWSKVKAVFSTGGKIFDGIKEGIVSAFKNIVNAIIKGINKVVKVPFDGINNALQRIKNVDLWGWKPFDFISTINVPEIPMLAQGAVIPPNKKFTAVLGDQKNGKNLEGPESLFRKIVREESGDKEVILNATFIMQCETEEIGRAALNGIHLLENIDGQEYVLN